MPVYREKVGTRRVKRYLMERHVHDIGRKIRKMLRNGAPEAEAVVTACQQTVPYWIDYRRKRGRPRKRSKKRKSAR